MSFLDLLFGKEYTDIDSEKLKEFLNEKEKYQFVDVRTKAEFKHRRIKGFNKNIDYYKFAKNISMLDRISKDKPVVVICETGARSNGTCNMLIKLGYKDVYNFRRGMSAWNGPTIK